MQEAIAVDDLDDLPVKPIRNLAAAVLRMSVIDAAAGRPIETSGLKLWADLAGIPSHSIKPTFDRIAAGDREVLRAVKDLELGVHPNLPDQLSGAQREDQNTEAAIKAWQTKRGERVGLRQMLEHLASTNKGRLVVKDVLDSLLADGYIKSRQTGYPSIQTTLRRAGWRRLSPGLWELPGKSRR